MPYPARMLPEPTAMIVAPQPEAVEAGADILRAGGSAVDAVIACAMMQGVVDPLMTGIGGFGIMNIHDPATGRRIVLDGQGVCPAAGTETMWADRVIGETTDGFGFIVRDFVNECGAQSVVTPSLLRLLSDAHEAFGKLAWSDLFQAAIDTAHAGWQVRPHVYNVWTQDERQFGRMNFDEKLAFSEYGRKTYMNADGSPRKAGSVIKNPDLASTLALIAREGAETFYHGALARHIAADLEEGGGILTAGDLASYAIDRQAPLEIAYRGRMLATTPPPGGGILISEILRILESFDLAALGHNSPEYIRVVVEAMKIATKDKDQFVGDPRFVPSPIERLLAQPYIDECAAQIRRGEKTDLPRGITKAESKHTTHISCVDPNGLVASMTHSLGNPSGFIVKDAGFMLNGAMASFDPRSGRPASIAPGKRRYSSMVPSIVTEDGKPVFTLGAPGASWIGPAVLQVILNVLDFGMEMQEAVMAPRFVATSNVIDVSNRLLRSTEREVQALGYETRRTHLSYAFAAVHGLTMFDGRLRGGADPQRDGYAQGVL